MSRMWFRWVVSGLVGIITGVVVMQAWPQDGPPQDPMRGVPPGGEGTATVVEHLATDLIYVDPDLTHLLPDDDRASLLAAVEGYDLPAYVAVVRSGHNDGWRSFLAPRIMRIADDVGVDGVYIAVDQGRDANVAYVHDGVVIDDSYIDLDEGSLGPALDTAIAQEFADDEYGQAIERYETDGTVTTGAVIGGAVLGVLAAFTAYGVLMLLVGIVRAISGLPFRPPVTRTPKNTPTGRPVAAAARDRSRR